MERSEIWAVEAGRIAAFFRSLPDVLETETGFRARDCEILVAKLEDRCVGRLHFPQTQVQFRGGEEAVGQMYRRFFLRFVSAGG